MENVEDTNLFYDKYKRIRTRDCNTGNLTECLTEPRLSDIIEQENVCGKKYLRNPEVCMKIEITNSVKNIKLC